VRVVALADSDSYVKWGAALLGTLGPEWERILLVVESQFVVNDEQLRAALGGTGIDDGERVGLRAVAARVAELRPDAVLVAAPGPVTMVLVRLVAELNPRPVIVTGMPGISIPVTTKALRFRRQSDLMIVHSRREVREFTARAEERGWDVRLGLARLPFAITRPAHGDDLVFAAQAVVPREYAERLEVARMLRDAALADPSRRVVVKLRARPGERSTHPERDAFPELLATLGPRPANLVDVAGPMSDALDTAGGFVTVSSTALLEALARGIPALTIDTFGVADHLINPVFTGSGLFGGRDDVIARRVRHPDPAWLDDNYFHDPATGDWTRDLAELVAARRTGSLAPRSARIPAGGALRAAWDRKMAFGPSDRSATGYLALGVGTPLRATVRLGRRLRSRLRRPATEDAA
jgi:hypothetical protein